MSKDPFHPLPIDESILAALVEGDLGGREAEEVRERLLAADPELAARVELMERDRIMLRALGDETPPTGLAESVVARLEREALLGLAGDERGSIPVSVVRPARPRRTGFAGWLTSPAGAGLAMAAMLALAAGATLRVLAPRALPPGQTGGPPGGAPPLNGETAIAQERASTMPSVMGEAPPPPPTGEPAEALAAAPEPEPQTNRLFTDDHDRALALLAEGRLLVRVRAAAPEEATAELARLAERPVRPNEAYRFAREAPEQIVLAMQDRFAPPSVERGPVRFATSDPDGQQHPAGEDLRVREPVSPLEAVYLADARLDASAIASLRHALSLGDGKVAVFEELAEPLDLPDVLTPDAVLWWNRPPGEWSQRAYVPVVIERVER